MKNNEYKEALKGVKMSDDAIERMKSIADGGDVKIKKVNFSATKTFRRIVSIAACLAIFVGIFSVAIHQKNVVHYNTLPSGVTTFKSQAELEKYLKNSEKQSIFDINGALGGIVMEKTADMAVAEGDVSAVANERSSAPTMAADGVPTEDAALGSYAKTYTQESGVDEADIIKTYGDLIFFAHTVYDDDEYYEAHHVIDIFRVKDGRETLIKTINCEYRDKEIMISDMYVTGDRLVVNGAKEACYPYYRGLVDYAIVEDAEVLEEDPASEEPTEAADSATAEVIDDVDEADVVVEPALPDEEEADDSYWEGSSDEKEISPEDRIAKTVSLVYDISDPENAKLIRTFAQSGSYTSSRSAENSMSFQTSTRMILRRRPIIFRLYMTTMKAPSSRPKALHSMPQKRAANTSLHPRLMSHPARGSAKARP